MKQLYNLPNIRKHFVKEMLPQDIRDECATVRSGRDHTPVHGRLNSSSDGGGAIFSAGDKIIYLPKNIKGTIVKLRGFGIARVTSEDGLPVNVDLRHCQVVRP